MELLLVVNSWLSKWEPTWLFLVLVGEMILSGLIFKMARIEFWYDKEWNERRSARRKKHLAFEQLTQGEHK